MQVLCFQRASNRN